MATLTDKKISNTYKDLLQVSNSNSGVDATSRYISDGEGTDSVLSISTTKVGIGTASPISALEVEGGLTTVGAILTLGTKEPSVVANDVLGRINFYAPLDTGTDSDEIGASIAAVAQATFSDSVNSTALVFQTGKSEVATTKLTLDEDGDLTLESPGVYKGYMPWVTNCSFYNNATSAMFVPLGSDAGNEDTGPDTNNLNHRLCMPYAGYLEKIVFRTQTTADTCDFEIYKAVSATDGDDVDQNKLSSTVSVEDGTAHTTVTATFGTNYSFVAGNLMGIKVTPESGAGDWEMTFIWRVLVD